MSFGGGWVRKCFFPPSAVATFIKWVLLSVLHCRILDIEHEMTQFAFYYVGIAGAVFLLGYFQVGCIYILPSPCTLIYNTELTDRRWSVRQVL